MVTTTSRLYAIVEADRPHDVAALGRLTEVLTAVSCASLLIRTGAPSDRGDISTLKALIETAQAQGIAALVTGDVQLAETIGADGVHLPWRPTDTLNDEAYAEARARLGSQRIVGADAGSTRDSAMRLAEKGADYIAFGLPAGGDLEGNLGGIAGRRRLDLIAWWADIFEVPCVAMDVSSPEDAAELHAAGADFITLPLDLGLPIEALIRQARVFAAALTSDPEKIRGE